MKEFDDLVEIVKVLRSKKGCPWDRAQKVKDYKKYLLEEAYELIEAIDGSKITSIQEELGDLFLILVMVAQIFQEKDKFCVKDSLKLINQKLILRHPHVFSDKKLKNKKEVLEYWVNSKAKKKNRKTVKERIPQSAPSLLMAEILIKEVSHLKRNSLVSQTVSDPKNSKISLKQLFAGLNLQDKASFAGFLFSFCQYAHLHKISLEDELRSLVLKKAEKITYKP